MCQTFTTLSIIIDNMNKGADQHGGHGDDGNGILAHLLVLSSLNDSACGYILQGVQREDDS